MYSRFAKALKRLHGGQKGMTGLETAIILIAFVTVASVLAYSVLSAGIFSAERGKATVYQGLESAQATMEVVGSVLGLSPNQTELEQIQFNVALTLNSEKVDMNAVVINYFDKEYETQLSSSDWSSAITSGSTERGTATMMEHDEVHEILITVPVAANVTAYEEFTVQVIPPTGATLTIKRTIDGSIDKVIDFH
jgi:flagellin FlaB